MPPRKKTKSTSKTPANGLLTSANDALKNGDVKQAERHALSVLKSAPANIEAREILATAKLRQGEINEAITLFEEIVALAPDNVNLRNNLAAVLISQKRHVEAVAVLNAIIAMAPNNVMALINRGTLLDLLGRREDAVEDFFAVLKIDSDQLQALKYLAETFVLLGRADEALKYYDKLVALLPTVAEFFNNRGTLLSTLNRHNDALSDYERALAIKPRYVDALNNRGMALCAFRRFDEALPCFDAAIKLDPNYVNAHWNQSLALLALGRFKEGWEEHEWRWQKPEFQQHNYSLSQPKWLGKQSIDGKTLLLTTEQGYGDAIHFSRYVPLLESKGAKVMFFVPEALVQLFQSSFPAADVRHKINSNVAFDYHCPVLSLPLALGTTLESIPGNVPYLSIPADLKLDWRKRLANDNAGLRVGIAWRGSPTHRNDVNRSVPLVKWNAVLNAPNVQFYALQTELSGAEKDALEQLPQVTILDDKLNNFADTAAVIESLDLVVSVDTAVAHLAGALGKPLWLLVPYVADWRWLQDRNDSPWYPTARLYWQPGIGQWPVALQQVAEDLGRFQPSNPSRTPATIGFDEALRSAHEFQRQGNIADAEAICQGLLAMDAANFDALQLMGTLHLQRQRVGEAISCYEKALHVKPESLIAIANLAGAMRLANRHEDALRIYESGLQLAPENVSFLINRAVSLIALKRFEEALQTIDDALVLEPTDIGALNNKGVVYLEKREFANALASFDAALAVKPDYQDALHNRGLALVGLNRYDEADRNYLHAISLYPANASAHNNRGLALASMNRINEALDCFQQAQALNPNYVDAHWNESLMNLVIGNYAEGWKKYEWRWQKPEFAPHKREFHLPLWDGKQDIKGRTIFLHFEQGFGDFIQFVRYVDCFDALGAKVILSAPASLLSLVRESFPHAPVFTGGDVLPLFDFHNSLLSLPLAFGTTLATIPDRTPYLNVPASYLNAWQQKIPECSELKVGLVWSGNAMHQNDRNRSLPMAELQQLLNTPNCRFYSLQKEVPNDDAAILTRKGAQLLGDRFDDFTDTAAAIMQLDLVISVDTSVAHLAGALGKPVWLLLAFAPDWRWLLDREDSPWYPTARLFRQPTSGDIAGQMGNVIAALKQMQLSRTMDNQQQGSVFESFHDLLHQSNATDIELLRRATEYHHSKKSAEALDLVIRYLQTTPDDTAALMLQTEILVSVERMEEAAAVCETLVNRLPSEKKLLNNLAVILNKLERHEDALKFSGRALELDANYFNALSSRELALIALNRAEEAIACDQHVLRLEPTNIKPLLNQGLMNLLLGNFADGWQQFESRFKLPEFQHGYNFPGLPLESVESLNDKTVLLFSEQGFGDSIQFIRYVELLHAAGAKVMAIVQQPLIELFTHSFPWAYFCRGGETLPPNDFYCATMSLPRAFATTLNSIPARIPYLQVPDELLANWRSRIPGSNRIRIGLVWSGNSRHQNDKRRSLPLTALSGLLQTPGCEFYALQKGISPADLELLNQHGVGVLDEHFVDFRDTTAAIAQLDLVISVDTSVAHLAGALGKPVWILLQFAPDWRWMLDRTDSPWYPTARLFRQPKIGDVAGQMRDVKQALLNFRKT